MELIILFLSFLTALAFVFTILSNIKAADLRKELKSLAYDLKRLETLIGKEKYSNSFSFSSILAKRYNDREISIRERIDAISDHLGIEFTHIEDQVIAEATPKVKPINRPNK